MATTTIPSKIQHSMSSRGGGLPNTTTGTISSSNSTDSIGSSSTTTSTTTNNIPTPTNNNTADRLAQIDNLKYFLATATENWKEGDDEGTNNGISTLSNIKRFRLPTGEDMSCVLWNDLFYITGTDIVRSLTFRFHAFGRPVTNAKKFEEGIFSDLRNLKPGNDARLEEPKSELLDMLYKNNCIRTQKKQKVFYWYSVPHDRLFLDALERDLKREKMDMEPTTVAVAEPASSLSLDSTQELFDQLRKSMSLSAAATAHALEDEAARCTDPHAQQGIWDWLPHQRNRSTAAVSVVANSNKQSAMTNPIRRSRVNSVPTTVTTTTTNGSVCARHHHHHLNHAGRPSPKAPIRPRVRNRATTPSAPPVARQRLSSTLEGRHAYANIAKPTPSCNNKMAGSSQRQQQPQPMGRAPGRHDQPASPIVASAITTGARRQSPDSPKSLDSNTLKKKKAIFGALSLFDGSPTYKQRRRRAASTSSGAAAMASNGTSTATATVMTTPTAAAVPSVPVHQHQTTTASPYAMMHSSHSHHGVIDPPITGVSIATNQQRPSHLHHHQSAPSTLTHYDPSNANNRSRLAMAAAAAATVGFVPTPAPACQQRQQQQHHRNQRQETASTWSSVVSSTEGKLEPERTYTCPQPSCGHIFKLLEHLDQHLRAHELEQPFMCPLCGKRFSRSEFLMEHQQINHQEVFDGASVINGNDCACSTSSPAATSPWEQTAEAAAVAAAAAMYTPATTLAPPPSLTTSSQYHSGNSDCTSNDHSRCSTLSPMLDLDHFYESTVAGTTTGLQLRSRTNSSTEDDSASSLTSSPASAIHLNQQTPQYFPHYHHPQFIDDVSDAMTPFMFNTGDHSFSHPPVTLFSSFKPELFQQQQQQQQQEQQQQQQFFSASSSDNVGSFQYDNGFQQHDQQYTSFVVPTDVSMAMM